jgi:hypothetical protein
VLWQHTVPAELQDQFLPDLAGDSAIQTFDPHFHGERVSSGRIGFCSPAAVVVAFAG